MILTVESYDDEAQAHWCVGEDGEWYYIRFFAGEDSSLIDNTLKDEGFNFLDTKISFYERMAYLNGRTIECDIIPRIYNASKARFILNKVKVPE